MTVTSGFFNSVNHDRLYDAEQLSSIFDGIILDGVYQGFGDSFEVVPNTELNDSVIVKTGRAWFDHTWTLNDADFYLELQPPNQSMSRRDTIVIDVDRRQATRKNSIKVITGTYGAGESAPILIRDELHNQYPIAYVRVPAGESGIVQQANIEILVGTDACPMVTGVLEVMNSDMFLKKFEEKFNIWFDEIKDSISDEGVPGLQSQIIDLRESIESIQSSYPSEELINIISNMQINYIQYSGGLRILYHTVLPDGCIFMVYRDSKTAPVSSITAGSSSDVDGVNLMGLIVNSDGVIVSSYNFAKYRSKYAGDTVYNNLSSVNEKMDSYPVTFSLLYADTNFSTNVYVGSFNINITSEHVVSCVKSEKAISFNKFEDEDIYTNSVAYMGTTVPMFDGSTITCASFKTNYSNNQNFSVAFSVGPDGNIQRFNDTGNLNIANIGAPGITGASVLVTDESITNIYMRGGWLPTDTSEMFDDYMINPATVDFVPIDLESRPSFEKMKIGVNTLGGYDDRHYAVYDRDFIPDVLNRYGVYNGYYVSFGNNSSNAYISDNKNFICMADGSEINVYVRTKPNESYAFVRSMACSLPPATGYNASLGNIVTNLHGGKLVYCSSDMAKILVCDAGPYFYRKSDSGVYDWMDVSLYNNNKGLLGFLSCSV